MFSILRNSLVCYLVFSAVGPVFASETLEGAKKDFATIKAELGKKLESAEEQLKELKKKTSEKGGTAKDKTVANLEAANKKVKKEFAELSDDGKDNWKTAKAKISQAIDSLNAKIQAALKD